MEPQDVLAAEESTETPPDEPNPLGHLRLHLAEPAGTRRWPVVLWGGLSLIPIVAIPAAASGATSRSMLAALLTALLTISALAPAVVGLVVVERPSARLLGGRLVWSGALLLVAIVTTAALSLALVVIFVGLSQPSGPPRSAAGVVALVTTCVVFLWFPLMLWLLISRSGPIGSSSLVVRRLSAHKEGKWWNRKAQAAANIQAAIVEMRDLALLEAARGDRRGCLARMDGLGLIARDGSDASCLLAMDELAFVGSALISDRTYGLKAIESLWEAYTTRMNRSTQLALDTPDGENASERQSEENPDLAALTEQYLHELCGLWVASSEVSASPKTRKALNAALAHVVALRGPGQVTDKAIRSEIGDMITECEGSPALQESLASLAALLLPRPRACPQALVSLLSRSGRAGLEPLARLIVEHVGLGSDPNKNTLYRTLTEAFALLATATAVGRPINPVASPAREALSLLMKKAPAHTLLRIALIPLRSDVGNDPIDAVSRGAVFAQVADQAWREDHPEVLEALTDSIGSGTTYEALLNIWPSLYWRLSSSAPDLKQDLLREAGIKGLRHRRYYTLYTKYFSWTWGIAWDKVRLGSSDAVRASSDIADLAAQALSNIPGRELDGTGEPRRGEMSQLLSTRAAMVAARVRFVEQSDGVSNALVMQALHALDLLVAGEDVKAAEWLEWVAQHTVDTADEPLQPSRHMSKNSLAVALSDCAKAQEAAQPIDIRPGLNVALLYWLSRVGGDPAASLVDVLGTFSLEPSSEGRVPDLCAPYARLDLVLLLLEPSSPVDIPLAPLVAAAARLFMASVGQGIKQGVRENALSEVVLDEAQFEVGRRIASACFTCLERCDYEQWPEWVERSLDSFLIGWLGLVVVPTSHRSPEGALATESARALRLFTDSAIDALRRAPSETRLGRLIALGTHRYFNALMGAEELSELLSALLMLASTLEAQAEAQSLEPASPRAVSEQQRFLNAFASLLATRQPGRYATKVAEKKGRETWKLAELILRKMESPS